MEKKKMRVILAKMGMDGHDLGLKFVANVLRGAGIEVVYLGSYQTPEKVLVAAIQESVDLIGISSLSGEYNIFVPQLMELLKQNNLNNEIRIALGGLIAKEDIEKLKALGVNEIFFPGDTSEKIIQGVISSISKV